MPAVEWVVVGFRCWLFEILGVIPSAAVFQAEREPALSEVEGDLAHIVTAIQKQSAAPAERSKLRFHTLSHKIEAEVIEPIARVDLVTHNSFLTRFR